MVLQQISSSYYYPLSGTILQLPTLLVWLKNVTLGYYWLESDTVSRVAMVISSVSFTFLTSTYSVERVAGVDVNKLFVWFCFLRAVTLTCVVSRAYLVVPLCYFSTAVTTFVIPYFFGLGKLNIKNS